MTLLDRFRSSARDKHPDAAVRLAYVDELPLTDVDAIAAMAKGDDDPKVRKAAVGKLLVPALLADIARDDADESVRLHASQMLRDLALDVFEGRPEGEALDAVDRIVDEKTLAHVAKSSTHDAVATRAGERVHDMRLRGSIARHAAVDVVRLAACQSVLASGLRDEILAMALNSEFKDTATAAVEALGSHEDLAHIIDRSRNKSAVKRARAIVRAAEEDAARQAAEAAAAEAAAAIAAEPLVMAPVEELASPPHGDPLSAQLADTATSVPSAEGADPASAAVAPTGELPAAIDEEERSRRSARLATIGPEAAEAAAIDDFAAARKRFSALRREWRALGTGFEISDAAAASFREADAAMQVRERAAQEADAQARREGLARVNALLDRVDALIAQPEMLLKAADRALRDVRAAMGAMPALPSKLDFEQAHTRFKAALAVLVPKVADLREADDWKRFANAAVQEQLCAKMEALKAATDLDAAAKEIRALQAQWKAAADVPRAQAEALWKRFKAAHDEVWARCDAYFAEQHQLRGENLTKKLALCEKAEALADSTQWIQAADAIKALQADWKTIGPVSRGKEKAIWDRFRTACDRFFTRRQEDLNTKKHEWSDNLAKKDALCAQAEALADSTDWDRAAVEFKRLQAEWKTIGPVKKNKSEVIWQRFRGACDRFFARYAQRHDVARADRVAAREALCAELEALSSLEEAPADLSATVRGIRGRWHAEVAGRGVDSDTAAALERRLTAAFATLLAKFPAAFAGSELDPETNRKRMEALVKRVEDLAASLTSAPPAKVLSPADRLATMLKEALASNTIGGKGDEDARLRAAGEELRQAQAAWARLGPVPDEARAPLTDRFHRAARQITDRVPRAPQPEPRAAGPRGPSGRHDGAPRRDGDSRRGDGRGDGRGDRGGDGRGERRGDGRGHGRSDRGPRPGGANGSRPGGAS